MLCSVSSVFLGLGLLGTAGAFTATPIVGRHSRAALNIVAVESAPPAGFVWADGLDSYDSAPNTIQAEALAEKKELLKAAAAEVVAAAAPFGDEVSGFATKWADKLVDSGSAADAAGEFQLIEECLIDSDDCQKLEAAIKKMQQMAGGDWAGTAC